MTDTAILNVPLDKELGIEELLDKACSKEYQAGRKEQNYWILSTQAQFIHDGTQPVVNFNQLMFSAHSNGYQYIQVTF